MGRQQQENDKKDHLGTDFASTKVKAAAATVDKEDEQKARA